MESYLQSKTIIMTNEQILQKVGADFAEIMQRVQDNPEAAGAMLTPIMELFTDFGFFTQMETGESNSIAWMLGLLVSMKDDLKTQKEFIDKFRSALEAKQDADAELNDLIETWA